MTVFGKREGGGRRHAERESVPLIAVFTTRTRSHSAVVADLSNTGARLRGSDLPAPGEDIIVNVEGLSAFATVIWSRLGFCGIAFEACLTQPQIWSLEQQARTARGLTPEVQAARDDWTGGMAR
jgi:hypothetical protein